MSEAHVLLRRDIRDLTMTQKCHVRTLQEGDHPQVRTGGSSAHEFAWGNGFV